MTPSPITIPVGCGNITVESICAMQDMYMQNLFWIRMLTSRARKFHRRARKSLIRSRYQRSFVTLLKVKNETDNDIILHSISFTRHNKNIQCSRGVEYSHDYSI
jgi:hypothetical protein